jgi:NADPH-dependent curcumin reductase CurA
MRGRPGKAGSLFATSTSYNSINLPANQWGEGARGPSEELDWLSPEFGLAERDRYSGDEMNANAGSAGILPAASAQRERPTTTALGVLGMPGLTAYFGLLDIGQPKAGETVVVSGAAGAVGMTVCQIAKIKGCRTVGIAGSDYKNQYLRDELGVDATINYKNPGDMRIALKEACPNGVDVYFDNVGGEISDAVLPLLKHGARIILCGQISLYCLDKPDLGPRPQPYLLVNSALMKGFIITAYAARFSEGVKQLAEWLAAGKLKYAESVVEGFENTPQAFIGLFSGDNLGKQIVKVA